MLYRSILLSGLLALLPQAAGGARGETPSAGARTLTVLTYNIKGLPAFAAGTYDQDRYADIGRILAERLQSGNAPDIVLLQESFVGRTRELREIAGYPYVAAGPGPRTPLTLNSGLYILSRYPIVEERHLAFADCTDWDCFANKGVQLARIKVPGVPFPVDVYNTHMQASRSHDHIRKRQVKAMAEFLETTRRELHPLIFAGDFNFRFGDPAGSSYGRFLAKTGLSNAAELCLKRGCRKKDDRILRRTVDHHFIGSSGVHIRPLSMARNFGEKVKGRPLSDHLGFEAAYELSWSRETAEQAAGSATLRLADGEESKQP